MHSMHSVSASQNLIEKTAPNRLTIALPETRLQPADARDHHGFGARHRDARAYLNAASFVIRAITTEIAASVTAGGAGRRQLTEETLRGD